MRVLSEADAAQWDEIQQWKASQLSDKRPRAITQKMKSAALAPVGKAVSIARKVPGGEALTRTMIIRSPRDWSSWLPPHPRPRCAARASSRLIARPATT